MADVVAPTAKLFNHVPGGINQLFLDGHVEFARYPGGNFASPAFAYIVGIAGD